MRIILPAAFAVLSAAVLCGCGAIDCGEPVLTDAGWIQGIEEPESGTCSYRGIPYAPPPTGDPKSTIVSGVLMIVNGIIMAEAIDVTRNVPRS